MAKFSRELDIDFWDVTRCSSTKPFVFQASYPGRGSEGIASRSTLANFYLAQAELGYPFRFVELAQEINRSMPIYVASPAQRLLSSSANG